MNRNGPLDDPYRIETPERLDLDYDVAGLGSRLIAALVDSAIQTLLIVLVFLLGIIGLGSSLAALARQLGGESGLWMVAAFFLVEFALLWGYYLFFEWVWHGQTPGKRLVGLRVIKAGGYPIGFGEAAIRNLVRIIDVLPGAYGVGAIVMIVDRRSRRLGDLAAGTLVVKERRELKLDSLLVGPVPQPSPPALSPGSFEESSIPNLRLLSATDRSLLREYFLRRPSLKDTAALEVASHLAAAFAQKLGHDLGDEPPEQFLARLMRQIENRY